MNFQIHSTLDMDLRILSVELGTVPMQLLSIPFSIATGKSFQGTTFPFFLELYCICILTALYLYLVEPMMMERGLWNFVYPHLSKSGHSLPYRETHFIELVAIR